MFASSTFPKIVKVETFIPDSVGDGGDYHRQKEGEPSLLYHMLYLRNSLRYLSSGHWILDVSERVRDRRNPGR